MDRLKQLLGLATTVGSILCIGIFFLSPEATDEGVRFLLLFAIGESFLDILFFTLLAGSSWLIFRGLTPLSRGIRADMTLVPPGRFLFVVLLLGSLAIPSYYYLRARYYFWSHLLREAYLTDVLQDLKSLAVSGRVQTAAQVANNAGQGLKGTVEGMALRSASLRLEARVQRSTQLARDASIDRAHNWNPVSERSLYFRLAEGLRLNPENHVAATALRTMLEPLAATQIERDAELLCRQWSESERPRWYTLSLLEGEVLRLELNSDNRDLDPLLCGQRLERLWQVDVVECLLAMNLATKPSPDSEDHYDEYVTRECEDALGFF